MNYSCKMQSKIRDSKRILQDPTSDKQIPFHTFHQKICCKIACLPSTIHILLNPLHPQMLNYIKIKHTTTKQNCTQIGNRFKLHE